MKLRFTMSLALPAALALAAPAMAQKGGELVVGAGSYNEAPVIEPGTYSDTIRGTETNVYAVELQPGQQLEAQVTVDKRDFDGIAGIVGLVAQINTPARVPAGEAEEEVSFASSPGTKVGARLVGPEVQESVTAAGDESYPASGRWYVEAAIDDPNEEVGRVEFPLELEVSVTGTPTAEEEPPIEQPEPEPEPAEDTEADASDPGGSLSTGAMVLIGIGGLAVGGAAGTALRRERMDES